MEELALQYENKAKAEKALLNAIELKIDALHKKIDSLQTLPKTELLEKKRSASESSDKDITAYYCSKDVKMEGRNIKCINQPEDTHAFCLLDWEGNRSFKAVFKIITKVTWLAFGTVDLKVFERQKKSFRSKTHKHGFNLITSEGYIFKTGGDTTSSDSFKALKKGDTVNAGDTLLIIEAMKVMNPIKASKGGTITQILVETGKPVEYGDVLMVIE